MTTLSTQSLTNPLQVVPKPNAQATSPVKKGGDVVVSDGQNPSADGKSVPVKPAEIGSDELTRAVSSLNQYVQNVQRDLEFSIDKDVNRIVIKVIDSQSKELIRQIPSQEILEIARALKENSEAGLIQVKV